MTVMIDAEYVLKIIGDQLYGEMSAGDESLYDRKTYDDGLEWCFELIRNVANNTVVDSEPVKHAHWIHDHDVEHYGKHDGAYWRCSSCGRILKDSNWFPYCPMCGARMDGGADDD